MNAHRRIKRRLPADERGYLRATWQAVCGCTHHSIAYDHRTDAADSLTASGWRYTQLRGWSCPACSATMPPKREHTPMGRVQRMIVRALRSAGALQAGELLDAVDRMSGGRSPTRPEDTIGVLEAHGYIADTPAGLALTAEGRRWARRHGERGS